MVSIGDLARAVAKIEDHEENFVSVYARAAREAGFITHKGRGKSAAPMTSTDAANLLIAVNGASLAKDAPAAVAAYRKMEASRWREVHPDMPAEIRELLEPGTTFGHALEQLIELFIPSPYPDFPIYRALGFLTLGGVSVSFHRPRIFATIHFECTDPRRESELIATCTFEGQDGANESLGGGRDEMTVINIKTLLAVGRILAT